MDLNNQLEDASLFYQVAKTISTSAKLSNPRKRKLVDECYDQLDEEVASFIDKTLFSNGVIICSQFEHAIDQAHLLHGTLQQDTLNQITSIFSK